MKLVANIEGICKMKKSRLYTKTGDNGQTSLVGGERVLKSDLRINLYGDIDELNSSIGVVISFLKDEDFRSSQFVDNCISILHLIQTNLFNLGSLTACLSADWKKYSLPEIDSSIISILEEEIDKVDSTLPPLKNFILPGGSKVAAFGHMSRTICRRVERKLVQFSEIDNTPINGIVFINRLSDYLFAITRQFNSELGHADILWNG